MTSTVDGQAQVNAGGLWYKIVLAGGKISLAFIDAPAEPALPEGALPGSTVATGTRDIARAWLAEPTTRYDHGILGDKNTAASMVIELRGPGPNKGDALRAFMGAAHPSLQASGQFWRRSQWFSPVL